MPQADAAEQFVQLLTEHQNRLFGYIYSLLGDRTRSADVLQETNLVLWRKLEEFDPNRPFLPWAFGVARFQVLAHLRDQGRDRMVLDADLIAAMCDQAEREATQMDEIRVAVRSCLQLLTKRNRELIDHRYFHGMSLAQVAASSKRTVGATKVALLRIRRRLANCVQERMAGEV